MGCSQSQEKNVNIVTDKDGYKYIQSKHGNMGMSHLEHVVKSNLSNDQWVLSPIYRRDDELKTDFQPGIVTGTCKVKEMQKNAMIREIEEELKLSFELRYVHFSKCWKLGKREWVLYTADLKNATVMKDNPVQTETREDDRLRKVMIILHGTRAEAMNIVKKTENI